MSGSGSELAGLVVGKHPLRELFLMTAGYYFVRTAFVAGGAAWLLERFGPARARKIFRIPLPASQTLVELRAAVIILIVDALFAAGMIRFDLFRHTEGWDVGTFALIFGWFEIWFYASHRLLHARGLYAIHAQHHTARVTTPLTSLSFSIAERLILLVGGIGVPAALSHAIPLSFHAYVAYFTVNYVLNVYGHLNVELVPPRFARCPLTGVLNTTTYHALHHARYRGHYGLFTPCLDRWFGTRFSDYERVHERAFDGQGLTRLGERIGSES